MWHQKAKGPPDGPPVFLIFVEKLNCPQSQAYQSISPVGTGLSLTDRALGVSLGTSIGNYSPLIAPQPVKLYVSGFPIRIEFFVCPFTSFLRPQDAWLPPKVAIWGLEVSDSKHFGMSAFSSNFISKQILKKRKFPLDMNTKSDYNPCCAREVG